MEFSRSRAIDRAALLRLYDAVGWSSYTQRPEDFGPMVENSWLVLSAWDAGEFVGLVRVVGDGATVAYIQDLLVAPGHQRRGIGRALLTEVLTDTARIRQVYITTDDPAWNRHVVALYRSLGFRPTPDLGCTTLAIMR
ncbi:GNAT family N-acetyltransferase [Kocuria sp.]|uniref:GNAT family N-acetyltransferase n=1 Tax=Kocuria sp. TaxID=1871328 RepID=UPI0026DD1313|nr:GNAT family N-acetyltransferase [Kocuria sp.]MDO4918085.1 GNAT family N-acetyltransferase [Kocuria sp.]